MGKPQRRFGKEFEAEAVRLVEVSGRTQREIAMDLGVGLSTLRRWLDKRREREIEAPAHAAGEQFPLSYRYGGLDGPLLAARQRRRLRQEGERFLSDTIEPHDWSRPRVVTARVRFCRAWGSIRAAATAQRNALWGRREVERSHPECTRPLTNTLRANRSVPRPADFFR